MVFFNDLGKISVIIFFKHFFCASLPPLSKEPATHILEHLLLSYTSQVHCSFIPFYLLGVQFGFVLFKKKKNYVFGCLGPQLWHKGSSLHHSGSFTEVLRLSCPAVCGILVPRPGITPAFPALKDGPPTTGSPGKSSLGVFNGSVLKFMLLYSTVSRLLLSLVNSSFLIFYFYF